MMGGTCLWVIGIICSLTDLELRFSVPWSVAPSATTGLQ